MRDLLFKGRRKDWRDLPKEKWWVEGDVSYHKTGKVFIKERFGSACASYEIEPETLSQYVEQNDIHNHKMWENDIVKETFHDGETYITFIQYVDKYAGFMVSDEGGCLYHLDLENDKWEVIGNIFDNPEILENQKILSPLEKAILKGLEDKTVKIKSDFAEAFGCEEIYCSIKGYDFYFEEYDKRLVNKSDYFLVHSLKDIAKAIANALESPKLRKEYDIANSEYNLCMFHLNMPEIDFEEEKEYE